MNIIKDITKYLEGKKVLILGFGREGKATYTFIKKYIPDLTIAIADLNDVNINEKTYIGKDYLKSIYDYDVVIKSPGIPYRDLVLEGFTGTITSQTDLLLKFNRRNIIGITGTKGKSTTSSLIFNILQKAKINVKLIGNIGVPPFECLEEIDDNITLVYEMSSHQLENVNNSPHISVFLNIFEEHLDHYNSYEDYQLAKVNIFRWQNNKDYLICNKTNELVKKYVDELANSNIIEITDKWIEYGNLLGDHNKLNIRIAVTVARLFNIEDYIIEDAIREFNSLPHRLEYVGEFNGIKYYNDSIATVPEATIAAIESIKDLSTLILGGMDRGINYNDFVEYLNNSNIKNIILAYETGEKIAKELKCDSFYLVKNLDEAVDLAKKITEKGKSCLLSPAAASYGYFKNFEERGDYFKKIIKIN